MERPTLDSHNSDAFRRLISGGGRASLGQVADATLAGSMELFATSNALLAAATIRSEISEAARHQNSVWHAVAREWARTGQPNPGDDIHGTRTLEFYRLRTPADQTSDCFQLFQERFVRSLQQHGFPKDFAYALAGVLAEMTDNVIQHSSSSRDSLTGMAGYHVDSHYMAFAVTDIGRGVLARLKDAEKWAHLSCAADALQAIVRDHASSRSGQGDGEGFQQLFRALVDRNVRIRLRTDDAAMIIADTQSTRHASTVASPPLQGFQVSVCCALDRPPKEIAIVFP